MVLGKAIVYYFQECSSNICFDLLIEWWVVPGYIPLSFLVLALLCVGAVMLIFIVLQGVLESAPLQGILVYWDCCVKHLLVG